MSIRSELEALKDASGELLQVDAIHTWAADNVDSALHASLLWDDEKAGYEFRLSQIRALIRVHISYASAEPQVAVISLRQDRASPGGGYRALGAVLATPSLYDALMRDALMDLRTAQKRYAMIRQLEPVWDALAEVERRMQREEAAAHRATA